MARPNYINRLCNLAEYLETNSLLCKVVITACKFANIILGIQIPLYLTQLYPLMMVQNKNTKN